MNVAIDRNIFRNINECSAIKESSIKRDETFVGIRSDFSEI